MSLEICVHRASPDAATFADNTISALNGIPTDFAGYIEFDIRALGDGKPFLGHDDLISINGEKLRSLTTHTIESLDAVDQGYVQEHSFSNLANGLQRFTDLHGLIVDIKDYALVENRASVIDPILTAIRKTSQYQQTIFLSWNWLVVEQLAHLLKDEEDCVVTGLGFFPGSTPKYVRAAYSALGALFQRLNKGRIVPYTTSDFNRKLFAKSGLFPFCVDEADVVLSKMPRRSAICIPLSRLQYVINAATQAKVDADIKPIETLILFQIDTPSHARTVYDHYRLHDVATRTVVIVESIEG